MIYPDTPESKREIDWLLDSNNFLKEDSCRTMGTLTDLTRILIRSAQFLTEDQKALIRGDFTKSDENMLREMGICSREREY